MTSQQRRRRGILGAGCLVSAATFVLLGIGFLLVPAQSEHHDVLVALWWGSAIAALALGVTACAVEDDGVDRPGYLTSIVHGLADEWRRPGRTS